MGNRAAVRFGDEKTEVYLHWNGGPESVTAFLGAMYDRGWTREDYFTGRLAGIVCEFFDADGDCRGYSLGVFPLGESDDSDNGTYHVSLNDKKEFVVTNGSKRYIVGKKITGLKTKDERDKAKGIRAQLSELRQLRVTAAKLQEAKS